MQQLKRSGRNVAWLWPCGTRPEAMALSSKQPYAPAAAARVPVASKVAIVAIDGAHEAVPCVVRVITPPSFTATTVS